MPRVAGQIDLSKTEAILEAAGAVFAEKGLSASMDEVARRACVSKQTIYNRYGSKADLIRDLVTHRVEAVTAPLLADGALEHPEEALAAYARSILSGYTTGSSFSMLRVTIEAAGDMPDVARAVYEAGPQASRALMARFLAAETAAGRMAVPDPQQAAEFFSGIVLGSRQLDGLLGASTTLTEAQVDAMAREVAARFMRAYAPG